MSLKGKVIGPYTLIKKLGLGGMGEVWLAENRAKFATTKVAVKLPLDEQIDHSLIEQEAQLWAKASGHPNILPIIEANEYDGQIVIVSEYSPDGSLKQLLNDNGGKLPIEQTVEITIGILKGLAFLHSKGIIHRDLKPDNVLMQGETPRLADFGISSVIKSTIHATTNAGTPYYMSPEAFKRERTVQTDIWSIGVMLYQMLKGECPFTGNNIAEIYDAIREEEPPPLPDEIPPILQAIVIKSLAKSPTERYQTADELRKELNDFWIKFSQPFAYQATEPSITTDIDETLPSTDLSIPTLFSPKSKTNQLYFAIPAITLLLITLIGGVYFLSGKSENTVSNANTKSSPSVSSSPNEVAEKMLIPFRKGDKWGFSDENKKIIIEPKYDDANPFSEGLASVGQGDYDTGKFGFIDKQGKIIVPFIYDEAESFGEGLAKVGIGDNKTRKYGFIDKTGKVIIPISYDAVYSFSGDLAAVCQHETPESKKCGFIDKSGKESIPLKYQDADSFSEGLSVVKQNGKYGFIDKTGNLVIPLKYDNANSFSEGLAMVTKAGKSGFIDKTGNVAIPLMYDDSTSNEGVGSFHEGLASLQQEGKYGFIDKNGNIAIPVIYDSAFSFNEGLAMVKQNNKYGFINKTGKIVIPLEYDNTGGNKFHEGLIFAQKGKVWGVINKNGNTIVRFKFYYPDVSFTAKSDFKDGLAEVPNDKEFYIDKNGTEYYEP